MTSILDVIAGIGLLKRRNWARILGIIGGILDLLAIPVGTAIGIYTIWILTKEEIINLSRGQVSEVKTDVETIAADPKTLIPHPEQAPIHRRFSRTAIVGTSLSALALFWMPAALIYVGEIHKSDLQEFIMWVCILIGCTPVFGTTILGMISITQIRHSAGRLYGMGLALFDALLFPVLALNIAIIAVCLSAGMGLPEAVILMLIIGGPLDFFLIRRAWRKANAGLEPVQIPTGETPQPRVVHTTNRTTSPSRPTGQRAA
ncbi:MAG: hypothetical protein ACYSW3_05140 [Planctomycetota bacterium]